MSQWNLKLWHVSIFDAHNFLNILGRNALLYLGKVGWWGRLGSALFCFAGTDTARYRHRVCINLGGLASKVLLSFICSEVTGDSILISCVSVRWFFIARDRKPNSVYFILFFCHSTRDLHSPTWDGTHAPCSGSIESLPLDHQGSPWKTQL